VEKNGYVPSSQKKTIAEKIFGHATRQGTLAINMNRNCAKEIIGLDHLAWHVGSLAKRKIV